MKVIGYSKYIKNFIDYKRSKKDISGNIFLEMLEKYFIKNIMDEEEIQEYEKLDKIKNNNINYEENANDNLMNIETNENEEKNNENENKNEINDFIDLREILSEEVFNEAKKDVFYIDNK